MIKLDKILTVLAVVAAMLAGLGIVRFTVDGKEISSLLVFLSILGIAKLSDLLDILSDFILRKMGRIK